MPNNEQKKKTGLQKHKEMVNSEEFRKRLAEHQRKLLNDPEYKAKWDKQTEELKRFFPTHETE